MALTRSAGARKDTVRGTVPIEVRKAAASRWSTTGVVAGGASPLVVGTAGFAYSVGAAGFVTSRGVSDGVHEFTNDGALSVTCPAAPGSGLSRIDIVYVIHPAAGENGDTTSQPILGVSSGTAASSSPSVPTIPTGALELARNTMTSAATTTASAGNTIAQTAVTANLRVPAAAVTSDSGKVVNQSTNSTGYISVPHSLGVVPKAFFGNLTGTNTAGVLQVGKLIPDTSNASVITFWLGRSDVAGAMPSQVVSFAWHAEA